MHTHRALLSIMHPHHYPSISFLSVVSKASFPLFLMDVFQTEFSHMLDARESCWHRCNSVESWRAHLWFQPLLRCNNHEYSFIHSSRGPERFHFSKKLVLCKTAAFKPWLCHLNTRVISYISLIPISLTYCEWISGEKLANSITKMKIHPNPTRLIFIILIRSDKWVGPEDDWHGSSFKCLQPLRS